jgi:hypothetical protein
MAQSTDHRLHGLEPGAEAQPGEHKAWKQKAQGNMNKSTDMGMGTEAGSQIKHQNAWKHLAAIRHQAISMKET